MLRNAVTWSLLIGQVLAVSAASAQSWPLSRRLGCTHVNGRYNFTSEDYINEGARQIQSVGMRTIRLWMISPWGDYDFNVTWPSTFLNLKEMAEHPYFAAVFNKPFEVYVLTAYSRHKSDLHYFRNSITTSDVERERQEFYELTKHLLNTYRGTGKIFVLQHWEGDWAVRGSYDATPAGDPSTAALQGMVTWLNARQDGVNLARQEITDSDVKVYHGSECNLVQIALQGRPTLVNNVWPSTYCDLYGYSAYDTIGQAAYDTSPNQTNSRAAVRQALNYMAGKAPDSAAFGSKNIYMGEFGWPLQEYGATAAMRVIRVTTEESLTWGCPLVLYWQLYDNECSQWSPDNSQCRGFWMVRADGTSSEARNYFLSLLNPSPPPTTSTVAGTVRDQFGNLVPVAAVHVRNVDSYVTASNGQYTLKLPPGLYQLTCEKPNYATQVVSNVQSVLGQTVTANIYLQLLPPNPVTNFTVQAYDRYTQLSWTNPANSHYAGTMIRYRTDRFPTDAGDGTLVVDDAAGRTTSRTYTHTGLQNAVTHYYAAFARNSGANVLYAAAVTASATPAGPGDLDRDGDVDLDDYGLFQQCHSGIAVCQDSPACADARMDDDCDVDRDDLTRLMNCFSGAGVRADDDCQ